MTTLFWMTAYILSDNCKLTTIDRVTTLYQKTRLTIVPFVMTTHELQRVQITCSPMQS